MGQFKKCFILSPDEIPFSPEPISSYGELRKHWRDVKLRYEHQGYYSTVFLDSRMQIPLENLHRYCAIVEFND